MLKTYALVATTAGTIRRRQQFEEGQQPQLAAAKGLRWILDNPPAVQDHQERNETLPIPVGATEVPYTVTNKPLAAVKLLRIAAAAAILKSKIIDGNYTHGDGHAYQLGPDKTGRWGMDNITAKGAEAGVTDAGAPNADAWPVDFKFVDAANADVAMTAAQMLDMAQGASAYVTAVRRRFWDLRASIMAAANVAAVLAIDVTTGWP